MLGAQAADRKARRQAILATQEAAEEKALELARQKAEADRLAAIAKARAEAEAKAQEAAREKAEQDRLAALAKAKAEAKARAELEPGPSWLGNRPLPGRPPPPPRMGPISLNKGTPFPSRPPSMEPFIQ